MCLTRAVILALGWQHSLVGSWHTSHRGCSAHRRSGLSAQDTSAGHSNAEPEPWHYLQTHPKSSNTGRTDPRRDFCSLGSFSRSSSSQCSHQDEELGCPWIWFIPCHPFLSRAVPSPARTHKQEELSLQSTALMGSSASKQEQEQEPISYTQGLQSDSKTS